MPDSLVLEVEPSLHTMHGKDNESLEHPERVRETEMKLKKLSEPYILAKQNKWKKFHEFFSDNPAYLTEPIDVNKNTALHLAAFCGKPKIFEKLLELLTRHSGDNRRLLQALRMENESGNTLLHEVASAGELEKAKSIFKRIKEEEQLRLLLLLEMRNKRGETPVFRAAAHGRTKLLKFFHDTGIISLQYHSHRSMDGMSILHIAVITQNFGTAIWLLDQEEFKELVNEKERSSGMTAFQLLAKMPSPFWSQNRMGKIQHIIYFLLPKYQQYDIQFHSCKAQDVLRILWYAIWRFLAKEWKEIDEVWKNKEMNSFANDLAKMLAKEDYSWASCFYPGVSELGQLSLSKDKETAIQVENDNKNIECSRQSFRNGKSNLHTPLLMAAANGITEIVEAIIKEYPQAIEHVSKDRQNILLVAFKHRQHEIYRLIKRKGVVNTLAQKIDSNGNTLFDYAQTFEDKQSQPSSALQLQSELRWFKRAEKLVPREYVMAAQHKRDQDQTPIQLFEKGHASLLQQSQRWIKEIAQSCSAVAVLVATVVFAAAFTVPGGTDEEGLPRFLRRRIFFFFTITDVLSLASSLASVVMFLSILTSHCNMWDFHKILPRKLATGFTLLFLSLATTMLSFSATILLNLKSDKNPWTTGLTYTAAFFPVAFLGLVQFPLYVGIKDLLRNLFKTVEKGTPRDLQDSGAWIWERTRDLPPVDLVLKSFVE